MPNSKLMERLGLTQSQFEPNKPNERFLDLESQVAYNIMIGNLEDPSEEENDE